MRKNIEAYTRYYWLKEELTEYIQIGAAALELLARNISVANGPSLLGGFVDACGVRHWTAGKKYADPLRKACAVNKTFSRYALVEHVAAFDLFSRNLVADFARFSHWGRTYLAGLSHAHQLVLLTPQARWGMSSCCNSKGQQYDPMSIINGVRQNVDFFGGHCPIAINGKRPRKRPSGHRPYWRSASQGQRLTT
jgi:hypothetical protein